jgi:hypothetical protein
LYASFAAKYFDASIKSIETSALAVRETKLWRFVITWGFPPSHAPYFTGLLRCPGLYVGHLCVPGLDHGKNPKISRIGKRLRWSLGLNSEFWWENWPFKDYCSNRSSITLI